MPTQPSPSSHVSLSDPNWTPTAYTYFDADLEIIWTSSVPTSDEQALTHLDRILPSFQVAYIRGRRSDGTAVSIK